MTAHSTSKRSPIFRTLLDEPSTPAPLHPGEVLREDMLPHFGVSAVDLAKRIGVPKTHVDELLAERTHVTSELAIKLGTEFAQSPGYWRALQLQHDLWHGLATAGDGQINRTHDRKRRSAA